MEQASNQSNPLGPGRVYLSIVTVYSLAYDLCDHNFQNHNSSTLLSSIAFLSAVLSLPLSVYQAPRPMRSSTDQASQVYRSLIHLHSRACYGENEARLYEQVD